jgi:hypothetical protein
MAKKRTTKQLVRLRVAARAGNGEMVPRGTLCEAARWYGDGSAALATREDGTRVGRVLRQFFALVATADEAQCRICGCTESEACPGGCGWEQDNVCSSCCNEMGVPRDEHASSTPS